MVECDYCGDEFPDTEAYLQHLADTHRDDLGRIDRRRVADFTGENEEGSDAGRYALAALGLVATVVVSMAVVWFMTGNVPFLGGNPDVNAVQEPYGYNEIHEHGTMNVTIAGDTVDFSQRQYQVNADCFHFERGNGRIWHTHCRGVTLQWALGTLGIDVNANGTTLSFDGQTYRDAGNWTVRTLVNGEPVEPGSYVLQGVPDPANVEQGDHVRVVVRRDS